MDNDINHLNKPLKFWDLFKINSYWLGLNTSSGIIMPILLPALVLLFSPYDQKNTYLAAIRVIGLMVAMLVQPIAGLLSDRSTSRFGRRKPFIFVGAILNVVFLAIIGSSVLFMGAPGDAALEARFGINTAYLVLLIGIILLEVSSNIGHGALQGLIPDLVPSQQRGQASGMKAVFELLPVFMVLFIGILIDKQRFWAVTGIIMAAFLTTMTITMFVKEEPLQTKPQESIAPLVLRMLLLTIIFAAITQTAQLLVKTSGQFLPADSNLSTRIIVIGLVGLAAMAGSILIGVYFGVWIGIGNEARSHGKFIWWVINRLLFLAAITSVQGFAMYFLKDVLHIPNAAVMTSTLMGVVALFLIPSAIAGGNLADRFGKTRLVGLAGIIAGTGTIFLILSPNMLMVIISGAFIGTGTGLFFTTNWALGTDLVPPESAGRYLGISNLAGAGAGIVGAGIGGPMADQLNLLQSGLGFLVIYAIYAGLFFISGLVIFTRLMKPS